MGKLFFFMSGGVENNSFQASAFPKISVLGVGGAGINAVNRMILSQLEGVRFIVANTDCQSLASSYAETKIQLGEKLTKGLGAGSNPQVGKEAAEEASDIIKREISDANMLFIATGMGGGTGTGASPVIAKIAKDMGILVVGITVKPFDFEGKTEKANKGIAELEKYVDTLIVVENQKLMDTHNLTVYESFAHADGIARQAVYCVVSILNTTGFINRDFADVRAVLSNGGRGIIGYGEDIDAKIAVDIATHNTVLENSSIQGAKNILLNITSNKNIKMTDIKDIVNMVKNEANMTEEDGQNIIFGVACEEELGDNIRVSIIASGVDKIKSEKADIIMASQAKMSQNQITDTTQVGQENNEITIDTNTGVDDIDDIATESPTFTPAIDEDDLENDDSFNISAMTEEIPSNGDNVIHFDKNFPQMTEKKKITNNNESTQKTKKKNSNVVSFNEQAGLFSAPATQPKRSLLSKVVNFMSLEPYANKADIADVFSNNEKSDEEIYNTPAIKRNFSNG